MPLQITNMFNLYKNDRKKSLDAIIKYTVSKTHHNDRDGERRG